MVKSKPRRWIIMPTYYPVTIPEIERSSAINQERQGKEIGKLDVRIRPSNLIRQQLLTIRNHEISQYFVGGKYKFKITVRRRGSNKPFHFRLQQSMPSQRIIYLESNIPASKYEREIEVHLADNSGLYRYFVEVYSELEWEESKQEIMLLEAHSFDKMVMYILYILAVLFGGGIGSLITWWFTR